MKILRTVVDTLTTSTWAAALFLLWHDPRINSLWVGLLLFAPTAVLLASFIGSFGKIWEHPKFGSGGDRADNAKIIKDVFGSRRDWRPIRIATAIVDLVSGSYMIYAAQGLEVCGAVFVAAVIARHILSWIDTTTPGRRMAKAIGIPLTPEKDLDNLDVVERLS